MILEKQIIEKKQMGDMNVVAQVLSKKHNRYISASYASIILTRPKSKLYVDAIEVLRKVIESREALLNSEFEPHS
jgi:hypothetical protein